MGFLKGKSSILIHERHGKLKYTNENRSFYCRGYYVDPAKYGNTFSAMGRDINNKDLSFNGKSLDKKSFSAPGDHVLCEDTYITGSSIATAFLTGAVSRILNYNDNISMNRVIEILISTCNDATSYSYGMINYNRLEKILDIGAKLW